MDQKNEVEIPLGEPRSLQNSRRDRAFSVVLLPFHERGTRDRNPGQGQRHVGIKGEKKGKRGDHMNLRKRGDHHHPQKNSEKENFILIKRK
jgi:hypothetical protein